MHIIDVAADGAQHNKDDGVGDIGYLAVDEQGHCHGNDDVLPVDACCLGGREHRSDDEGDDSGTDTLEDAAHNGVVFDCVGRQEDGDSENHQERRQDGADGGANASLEALQSVPDDHADVHRQNAGHGLGDSEQVQELIERYPLVLLHNLALDDADHRPTAAKREGADFAEGEEQLQIEVHFSR